MCMEETKEMNLLTDRISEMPDEILSVMLQLLPMKEAARTSILSRKWRFRWKSSVAFCPAFDLNVVTMRGNDYPEDMFGINENGQYRNDHKVLSIERHKFVEWVETILKLEYRPVMDTFRLRYYFEKEFGSYVDQWIALAVSKKVKFFDIDLSHFHEWGFRLADVELYTFPYWLFAQETLSPVWQLNLKSCIFKPPTDFNVFSFSSLLHLKLENVLLNENSFASFLSNCPNLEELTLKMCLELRSLKISASFEKLKYLAVENCRDLSSVEIFAKNLAKFEYRGVLPNFSIGNVHQLSGIIVDIHGGLDHSTALNSVLENFCRIPTLESLMMTLNPIKRALIPRQFANLKKLVLTMNAAYRGTLWVLVPLFHAMPCLEMLELNWWLISCPEDCEQGLKLEPPSSPLWHLQDLTISGIFGTPHEIEFTTYLLNNAPSLKKLLMYHRSKKCYPSKDHVHMCELPKEASAAEQTRHQILNVVPPQVEFLFL